MSTTSILGCIQHYQRSIEKCQTDEARLLHCISKLYKLPIKVEHLQETGIGKTVNSLRKFDGEIGTAAKTLVAKWKAMVAAEEEPMETSCHQDDDEKPNGKDNDSDDDDDDDHKDHNKNTEINGNHNKHHSEKSQSSSKDRGEQRGDVKQKNESDRSSKNSSSSKSQHRSTSTSSKAEETVRHKHENKSSSSSSSRDKNSATDKHHKNQEKSEKSDSKHEKPKDSYHDSIDKKQDKQKNTSSSHKPSKESSNSNETRHHHSSKREKDSHSAEKESSHHRESVKHENRSNSSSKEKDRNSQKYDSHKHEKHKSSSKDDRSEKNEKHKSSSSKDHDSDRDHNSGKKKHGSSAKHTSSSPSTKTTKDKPSTSAEASLERKRKHDSEQDLNKTKSPKAKLPKHIKVVEENNEDEEDEEGIDSSMGANFADVLVMLNVPGKKLKKISNTTKSPTAGASTSSSYKSNSQSKDTSSSSSSKLNGIKPSTSNSLKRLDTKPDLLSSYAKLEPLDPSIAMELPIITTNYKPLPLSQNVLDVVFPSASTSSNAVRPPVRTLTDAEALSHGISSKTMRTKIYSGVRTGQLMQVPTLFDLCIRVLQKNIDALEYTGGVPFEVLRAVLERASPQQLLIFEEYNPYLMEDCDILWQQHVSRHYRAHKRQELESWREMFLRCQDDQERKLNILAESIKQSQKIIAAPVRKTQMAFVDSMVKPPRNVQRKQEQFGTKSKLIATPASRVAALSSVTPNAAKTGDARLRVAAAVRDNAQVASIVRPLKKAPLMAKTLQFMRGRHKR